MHLCDIFMSYYNIKLEYHLQTNILNNQAGILSFLIDTSMG
jgi:hypothetical protein